MEARNEEFPMTLGFLELMKVLTENPVPAALGAGYRAPGFDPYLKFLRDSIFLEVQYKSLQESHREGIEHVDFLNCFCFNYQAKKRR